MDAVIILQGDINDSSGLVAFEQKRGLGGVEVGLT
jgi:hypothetical protein